MPGRHRRHGAAFKLELIRAYLNGEGSYKSIASKHDISHALLMTWVEKYRSGDLPEEVHDAEKVKEYEATIAALERKVGQLVMELDLLKKEMSRPGTPTDNPQAESFMKTLKYEEIYALDYATLNDVEDRLPRFIDEVYNRRRIHSALGYVREICTEICFGRGLIKRG